METLIRYKNPLLLIALVVALFIIYSILFGDRPSDTLTLLRTQEPSGEAATVERELLGLLLEIKSVELDGSIFSDPAFRSLKDFGQELISLPVGRSNPFAPFGVGNFPTSSQ